MKITNLIALPFALAADAVTLGEAGVTRRIFRDEQDEKMIKIITKLAEIKKGQSHDE